MSKKKESAEFYQAKAMLMGWQYHEQSHTFIVFDGKQYSYLDADTMKPWRDPLSYNSLTLEGGLWGK